MSRRKRTSDLLVRTLKMHSGESIRGVARSLDVNEATLHKRLKRVTPATSLGRYNTTFSPEMEQELCDYIKEIDGMFYGLTP